MNNYELYHWGIKGMKWGVRRYQNPDGSLTEAGKRRQARKEARLAEKEARKVEKKTDELRKKPLSKLTDAELKARIERLTKEKQALDLQKSLSEAEGKKVSNGEKFMSTAVSKVIAPALVDAGKEVLTKWLKKKGYDLSGLGESNDVFSQLTKEANIISKQRKISDDKLQIRKNNEEHARRDAKEKEERDKAAKKKVDDEIEENVRRTEDANKKRKQEQREAEEREARTVYTGKVTGRGTSKKGMKWNVNSKERSPKSDDYYDPIETYFVDRDVPISNAKNTRSYQVGLPYLDRLLLTD